MLCNYCWKEKDVEEFSPSVDDLCLDCHRKLTQPMFADEVGISASQVKWAVSELNKRTRRIAELEAENADLKAKVTNGDK